MALKYFEMERGSLKEIFEILLNHFGPQNWWPAETPLEVIVGAVLTQNTSWKNVEKAIANLKEKNLMDLDKLVSLKEEDLAELIKSSGFYNLKARRLRLVLNFLKEHGGVEGLKEKNPLELRRELLKIPGVGKETADSIILYALEKPVFVVDSYTKRILARLGFINGEKLPYDEVQRIFHETFGDNLKIFNEFHALLVALGKTYCLKRKPKCNLCPLRKICLLRG